MNKCAEKLVNFVGYLKTEKMIKVAGRDKEYAIELGDGIALDGESINWDIQDNGNGSYHIIHQNGSFNLEVVSANYDSKEFEVRVNQTIYTLQARDQFDELLEKLGMDNLSANAAEDLKAPMPGLVIDIKVSAGQEVTTSDVVLVLEAMKMENNIKAPANGIVKSIEVDKGAAVEKGQVLVTFE
jgi:biotin carboxyl carrier protein